MWSGGEAESAVEEVLAGTVAVEGCLLKYRLEVERFPERTRFDIFRFEGFAYFVGCVSVERSVERDAGEPVVGVVVVVGFLMHTDAFHVAKQFAVQGIYTSAVRYVIVILWQKA